MRPGLFHLASLAVLCTAASACIGTPQVAIGPGHPANPTVGYADAVLSIIEDDANGNPVTQDCTAGLPTCAPGDTTQTGDCAAYPVLGPPDSSTNAMGTFDLTPHGVIVIGFQCSDILQVPSPTATLTPDFYIYGTVTGGAHAVVSVSNDLTTYASVNPWVDDPSMPGRAGFELSAAMVQYARYVRISETAGVGNIYIDAIEALATPQ